SFPTSFSQSRASSLRSSFFFHATATTEIYTLSLHDALPISLPVSPAFRMKVSIPVSNQCLMPWNRREPLPAGYWATPAHLMHYRSEEHTSELQSRENLVCRLLLEKKKKRKKRKTEQQSDTYR